MATDHTPSCLQNVTTRKVIKILAPRTALQGKIRDVRYDITLTSKRMTQWIRSAYQCDDQNILTVHTLIISFPRIVFGITYL